MTGTDEPILVIDIGGTAVKLGYALAGRLQGFRRTFATETLR